MESKYSVEIYRKLETLFNKAALHRPMKVDHFEAGTELEYNVTSLEDQAKGKVKLSINKFVGGGFAGQVYQVKVLNIDSGGKQIGRLEEGKLFAMKILIPPSAFSKLFRNFLYWIGFQGPFQIQVNPAASRAGALWQKFLRRAAGIKFGTELSVVDIHCTFIDKTMGSCGELSEWLDGRTWRLEVDENYENLKRWAKGKSVPSDQLGSPEFRAKYKFMHDFVDLLHEIGAHEFARQYEWSTWKSQPNCLKRSSSDNDPAEGLTAVDFRAGLALLPFLPMSPGDFKLIWNGLSRGSLVQFDRGDIKKLEDFISRHKNHFAGAEPMLEELKRNEEIYRNSIPDITHNHFRLLFSKKLWSTMISSFIVGWRVRNFIDEKTEEKLRGNKFKFFVFYFLGAIPLLGRFIRRIWGRPEWRAHYKGMFSSFDYLRRAFRGKFIEKIIRWYRAGRISGEKAMNFSEHVWKTIVHIPLSILPAGLHRFLSDWSYFKEKLDYLALRPFRLYFNAELRTEWLRDMVLDGRKKHLLTSEDADEILSQVDEPFIQKYLKSLAVHVATLPVTQVVSVLIAIIYIWTHPEMPRAQAYGIGLGIIALFQVVPISPGSLVRGLYVVWLVIKDRNFRDYNIAVFLGFFKYIGYLAFPIQMAYRYPTIARFMAGHWATEAVHVVPVFGEHGALMEHKIFGLFYNRPLSLRVRMKQLSEMRLKMKVRSWHIPLVTFFGAVVIGIFDYSFLLGHGILPTLKEAWIFTVFVPLLMGTFVNLGAGGASVGRRIMGAVYAGVALALIHTFMPLLPWLGGALDLSDIVVNGLWKIFIYTILTVIGSMSAELMMLKRRTFGK